MGSNPCKVSRIDAEYGRYSDRVAMTPRMVTLDCFTWTVLQDPVEFCVATEP
jgi:hypothetical protein